MSHDVFISYSRKDIAIANRICEVFDKYGISYFIDLEGIGGGYEFPAVLAEAILDCRVVLFLASENSYNSKFTNAELTFAFNEKPKNSILPYIIDGSTMPPALRFIFSSINRRTIKTHPIETTLVEDMLRLLGRQMPQPVVNPQPPKQPTQPQPRKQPLEPKRYKVGDYYNENGREGVVFYVDESGVHGKIVSMQEAEHSWAINKEYGTQFDSNNPVANQVGADSPTDGVANMQVIQAIKGWREKYPAFAWCASLGTDWYLPAIDELKLLLLNDSVHDAVNKTLIEKEGIKLADKNDWMYYWSSTENGNACAWFVNMGTGRTYKITKNFNYSVRAVSAF